MLQCPETFKRLGLLEEEWPHDCNSAAFFNETGLRKNNVNIYIFLKANMPNGCGDVFLVFVAVSLVQSTSSVRLSQAGQVGWACEAGPSGICLHETLLVKNLFQGRRESGTTVQLGRGTE